MPEDRAKPCSLERALDLALAEHRLDGTFRATVRNLVQEADDSWRICCGSTCEPCIEQVARAVDRVRELCGVGR